MGFEIRLYAESGYHLMIADGERCILFFQQYSISGRKKLSNNKWSWAFARNEELFLLLSGKATIVNIN